MSKPLTFTEEELFTLALCSMRYALGRQTYIVDMVCTLLRKMRHHLLENNVAMIRREIERALDEGRLTSIDVPTWRRVVEAYK